MADNSFEGDTYADVNTIITEFPGEADDSEPMLAAKKLQGHFDDVAGTTESSTLKVFLRVRPSTAQNETTIQCVSDTEIITTAPEVSNRAKYTKTEERQYVSHCFVYVPLSLALRCNRVPVPSGLQPRLRARGRARGRLRTLGASAAATL